MPEVDHRCEEIKEQNEKSTSSIKLANNLRGLHYNILYNVKYNLAPSIEHLIKAPDENKFHWWFCLFLYPRYAVDLKEIIELHRVEGVHSKTVILEMKDLVLDDIAACENVHNPIVAPISSTVK